MRRRLISHALGKDLLWVAKQHGHSVQTMLDTYTTWIDGSQPEDIEAIRQAMKARPPLLTGPSELALEFDPPHPFCPPSVLALDDHTASAYLAEC